MKNLSKILFVMAATVLIGCGNEKKQEENEDFTISGENTTVDAVESTLDDEDAVNSSSDSNVVEISLTANDQMQFGKNEIKVKAGQTVRLTLEHVGQMQENVMGHNFVLLKQGTNINEFGQAAAQAADNDYIPQNSDKVIAHTEIIGGGETTTIEFTAPAAGTYDFICSFPGHYALMQGKFIVE
ncbi:azurin [Antarcticibacterium sp. 1MA-6-2]|uniref:azurin n=1 Tax=Antarcticibacterium sp. 1MA-6-2 TaxID=2908210 RepID=UPI001F15C09C|nr:azurin [Antarcticibacterium sp. 1MA-6-2]UJH91364.1 azurin [Antarcticibacterium sp. 1MA-6-2]